MYNVSILVILKLNIQQILLFSTRLYYRLLFCLFSSFLFSLKFTQIYILAFFVFPWTICRCLNVLGGNDWTEQARHPKLWILNLLCSWSGPCVRLFLVSGHNIKIPTRPILSWIFFLSQKGIGPFYIILRLTLTTLFIHYTLYWNIITENDNACIQQFICLKYNGIR